MTEPEIFMPSDHNIHALLHSEVPCVVPVKYIACAAGENFENIVNINDSQIENRVSKMHIKKFLRTESFFLHSNVRKIIYFSYIGM